MDDDEAALSLFPSAAELLEEIQSESLQQLLTEIRHDAFPVGGTQILPLDNYMSSSLSRPLGRGDIIEIQGPSASGKTHIVYQLIQTCILPAIPPFNGWGKAAVILDADGTFDVCRLRTLLETSITLALTQTAHPQGPAGAACILQDALARVRVMRPTSTLQLAASLCHLEHYVATDPRMQHTELALVVVDSVSAFYWPDRFTVEQYRYAPREERQHIRNPFAHVVTALQRIRTSLRPVIVLTNWALNVTRQPGYPLDLYRQHLRPFVVFASGDEPAPPITQVAASHGPATAVTVVTAPTQESETDEAPSRIPEYPSLPVDYHVALWPTTHQAPSDPETDSPNRDSDKEVSGRIRVLVRTAGKEGTGEFFVQIGQREVRAEHAPIPSPASSFLSYEDP